MKNTSLFGLMVSLAVLGVGSLPVSAQSQRYPTDTEMRQLTRSFHRVSSGFGGRTIDKRPLSNIQAIASFARDWSRIEPAIAPFFGKWLGLEESLHIFPSNVRGRVCIINSFLSEPYEIFSIGSLSNGEIRTSGNFGRAIIIKQGNRLGLAGIYKNAPSISAFEFPRPLKSPTDQSFFGLWYLKQLDLKLFNNLRLLVVPLLCHKVLRLQQGDRNNRPDV